MLVKSAFLKQDKYTNGQVLPIMGKRIYVKQGHSDVNSMDLESQEQGCLGGTIVKGEATNVSDKGII
jgi:hypothetical protein